jgi:anti-sigma B factor antagonist
MKLDTKAEGDVTVMRIAGEFNSDAMSRFNKAIDDALSANRRDFVIDLEKVTSIDSTGLELMTALQRRCVEELGMVRVSGADEEMRKVFEITRIDQQIELYDTIEQAYESLMQ